MATREELRTAALATGKRKSVLVEVNGQSFEVRRPTPRVKGDIVSAGKPGKNGLPTDYAALEIEAVLKCTYVPGSDDRVFSRADEDSLLDGDCDVTEKLSKAALELMDVDTASLKKTSETTSSDNSSS